MKVTLIETGKTKDPVLDKLSGEYYRRISHYCPFTVKTLPDLKNTRKMSEAVIKQKEGEMILKDIAGSDHVILLDEGGREYTSVAFSGHLQSIMNRGLKELIFVIGGPYGFHRAVYQRADEKLSLSRMTFSHQMVRIVFAEQLYRAFTILNNEPYHHQ